MVRLALTPPTYLSIAERTSVIAVVRDLNTLASIMLGIFGSFT